MVRELVVASVVHAQVMAAIHAAAFAPQARWSVDAMALQLTLPGAFGLIAAPTGFIVVRVAADEAEILTLAVVPSGRRRGAGGALLDAAMGRAWSAGARTMFLEVAQHNAPARGLYAACGFAQVGRRRGYYGPGADALVLRSDLTSSAGSENGVV